MKEYKIPQNNGVSLEGIAEVPFDEQKGDETNRIIDKSELQSNDQSKITNEFGERVTSVRKDLFQKKQKKQKEEGTIEYERLSEFFFDLCVSWCQH